MCLSLAKISIPSSLFGLCVICFHQLLPVLVHRQLYFTFQSLYSFWRLLCGDGWSAVWVGSVCCLRTSSVWGCFSRGWITNLWRWSVPLTLHFLLRCCAAQRLKVASKLDVEPDVASLNPAAGSLNFIQYISVFFVFYEKLFTYCHHPGWEGRADSQYYFIRKHVAEVPKHVKSKAPLSTKASHIYGVQNRKLIALAETVFTQTAFKLEAVETHCLSVCPQQLALFSLRMAGEKLLLPKRLFHHLTDDQHQHSLYSWLNHLKAISCLSGCS